MGLVAMRTNLIIRGVELSVPPHNFPEGERLRLQPVSSDLINFASIKTPEDGVWLASGLVIT